MVPIYCEKSLHHLALRIRYNEIHPDIANTWDVDCTVHQSANSRWPLPAELYLVFDKKNKKILYFFTQMAKCRGRRMYIVAHKSGSLEKYQTDIDIRTFETCHEANKFFLSTLSEISHILERPFIKMTDKLFTFEQNFVMQNKVKLRRESKKRFVVFGLDHGVDQLVQSMIDEPILSQPYLNFGQESTFFGYPNRYAVQLAQSYLNLIKSLLHEKTTRDPPLNKSFIQRHSNISILRNYPVKSTWLPNSNPTIPKKPVWSSNHSTIYPNEVMTVDDSQHTREVLSNPVYEFSVLFHMFIPYLPLEIKNICISNRDTIKKKQGLLDALQSQEVARSYYKNRFNKIDVHLSLLDHPLMIMDRNSIFYHQIETCVEKTSHSLRLVNVLEFDKTDDNDESRSDRFLLWHGTSVSNIYSILKNGFDINRANNGLFGRGIYFADAVGKSQNYCNRGYRGPSSQSFQGLAFLLCEVKLGRICDPNKDCQYGQYDSYKEKPDKSKYDSFVVKGRLEPSEDAYFKDDFNAKFYSQNLNKNDTSRHGREWGEFVVFDTNRIKVRYVVHCEYSKMTNEYY